MVPAIILVVLSCTFGTAYASADLPINSKRTIPITSPIWKDIEIAEGLNWVKVYGPARRQPPPKCDLITSIRFPKDAALACKIECKDISAVVDEAFKRFGAHFMIRRLYSECHGFFAGQCIQLYSAWFTHCQCIGPGFSRSARYCRILIVTARMSSNMGVWYTEDFQKWHQEYQAKRKEMMNRSYYDSPYTGSP